MRVEVPDLNQEVRFPIDGLQFERNLVQDIQGPAHWFARKLSSSTGPLISDFVTHEANFSYSTYGIHVGQDDRLTFMGNNGKRIQADFVDCRRGSPTLHHKVSIRFAPTLERRLIIPRGVAHTFDDLEYIVTRDEPVWYSDKDNPDWNIDNDLISVMRESDLASFPIVRANEFRLPDEAHLLLSRISQTLLENPRAYMARFKLTIGSEEKYVMFEPRSWTDDDHELKALLNLPGIPGVEVRRSRYALTGPSSWTLVPNTAACVADVLVLPASPKTSSIKFCHTRTRKWYTFLTNQGLCMQVEFVDCRRDSPTIGLRSLLQIKCDPRVSIAIQHGIAYSFHANEEVIVRCEHELFADEHEPRTDLPPFGQDLKIISDEEVGSGLTLPTLRCPDELVYRVAQHEMMVLSSCPKLI